MRLILFFALLLNCSTSIRICAQADWAWAISAYNLGSDVGKDLATDQLGNTIITGYFNSTNLVFDTVTVSTSTGNANFFLAKFDPNGNVIWGRTVSGSAISEGSCVSTDLNNNIYLCGNFTGNLPIGDTILVNTDQFGGTKDIFISKFDASGNFMWARNISGNTTDVVYQCASPASGGVIVTGAFFSATLSIDNIALTNYSNAGTSCDGFAYQFDSQGNIQWSKSYKGPGDDYIRAICEDNNNNILLGGTFRGNFIIIEGDTLTNNGINTDFYLAKYDSSGNFQWKVHEGGKSTDGISGICVGPGNEIYVTGEFKSDTLDLSPVVLINTDPSNNTGDLFIARYSPFGMLEWAISAGGNRDESSGGIDIDGSGNIFISGSFDSGTINFGNTTLINTDLMQWTSDIFTAKCNSSGVFLWALSVPGSDHDGVSEPSVDPYNTCTITGFFKSPEFIFSADSLINSNTSNASYDVFVARIEDPTEINSEEDSSPHTHIYPNPVQDRFVNIITPENSGYISFTGLTGATLLSFQITDFHSIINLSTLPPGIYTVYVYQNGITSACKLVIME